ncbi:hypothetical protein BG910_00020 [Neisseria chenwenguii]|uniref:VanZ-like domain-containing protein n=1 Tax=Neisseria chenwenguii TaxID=1853278 RepID=A0A220RYT8_9NEIS|nr:VanZ family protein [Neisseria chenwenguii]ASK26344.1 hypothetical protein BG910_00020 [Neisseria chenwenguii]
MPRNKFTVLVLLWFAAGIYALLFRESGSGAPPFPNFDKVAHFTLFFAQIWLLARTFIEADKTVPYHALIAFALVYAVGSELAQAAFTATREGSFGDGLADMGGCLTALWLAKKAQAAKRAVGMRPSENSQF